MTDVVVLGATGMLGHKVLQRLTAAGMDVVGTVRRGGTDPAVEFVSQLGDVRSGVDASDFATVEALLTELRPAVIVNAIGIVKQKPEADDAIPSITVNALLPHLLDRWCREHDAALIHFSTDCVFSGDRGGYMESDIPDAYDLYGRTKLLGEVTASGNALTLRTSIIGRELESHRSLVEWFLSQDGGEVSGFTRVMYSGVTTIQASRVVEALIRTGVPIRGLYQLAGPWISKHDLLVMIRDEAGLDIDIVPEGSTVLDRTMVGERFTGDAGIAIPSWRDMISDMVGDPTPYGELHE